MSIDAAIGLFDSSRQAYLQDLLTFLRFQTISAQKEHAGDLRTCAAWIRDQLAAAGVQAEIMETGGHPLVFGDTGPVAGGGPTLLFYGHYDVQPVGDVGLWRSPAFEPTIRDGAIFARGSADDKGQVMTHLAAMRSWRASGSPWPVRMKFLFEGEEEVGSKNLKAFVRAQRDLLACDYVVLSDTSKLSENTPALGYSSRGLVYKEITLHGPTHDLHSGTYGGAVGNPANALASIIASLHDEKRRVTIPGFYDDVVPLTPDERRQLAPHSMSDAELLAATGSPSPFGEEGYTTGERTGARPTLDVNGILAGYVGEGSSTIIPARAMAKISMRLVANQDPEKISDAFNAAVQRACPAWVRLEIKNFSMCPAYMAPTDSPGMLAAVAALAASYGTSPAFTREGGSLPILPLFKQVLSADSIMLGFADANCNLHSPNEFFHIRDFEVGTRCVLQFIASMGQKQRA
jgi:acetylornithine deacetylase/succinyl-diaminopimelate desuccinylase-like protein